MRSILPTILILALALPTLAADPSDLTVNGFISQGWLNTSHNNYLVDDSRDGSMEFHEAGMAILSRLDDDLHVGLQFLARDFGEIGNNTVLVDWAYGDWRWRDSLGVRLGKFKTPHGLYGQGRDIDLLRPTVLLPQSVYNESHRDFILGTEGVSIYGNVAVGHGGSFDYEFYGGAMNIPDPSAGFWHDQMVQAGLEQEKLLQGLVGGDSTVTFAGVVDLDAEFDMVYGGALYWSCPSNRFRFGVSGMTTSFYTTGRYQYHLAGPGAGPMDHILLDLSQSYGADLGKILIVSGEYRGDRLTLATEFYQEKVEDVVSEGFYAMAALKTGPRTTWSGYFSRYLRDKDDPAGRLMLDRGFPDFVGWQNDYCLALRVDPKDFLTLKAEYHAIDGMGLLSTAKNVLGDPDAYKQWWSFATAKVTIHF